MPFGRVCPLLAGVQLVEDREESRLLHFAVRNSASDLIEAIKNALADGARGGNHHDERLTARGGGLFHNLVEAAILYRVELVNDYGVRIQAVQGVRVRGEGLKGRGRGRKIEIIPPLFQDGPELRRLLHHVYSFGEDFFRLVSFGGDGVDFRRALIIRDQHIERNRGEECRFAIFTAHKKHCLAVSAETRLPLKETEKGLNIGLLEKLELERGADHALRLLAKPLRE